jgi:hypothetical protein
MKHFVGSAALTLTFCAGLVVGGCTPTENAKLSAAASSPAGQLFCAVQAVGIPMVVGMLDAEASALAPSAAPVAVLAAGMAKAYVDAICAKAGGIAVSPPANPAAAARVAVVLPLK